MIKGITSYFIPEEYLKDRDLSRKSRLLVNTFFYTIFNSALYLGVSAVVEFNAGIYAMVYAIFMCLASGFLYRARISPVLSANIFLAGAALGVFFSVYFSGGFDSPVLPWFSAVPIAALLIGGYRSGFAWTIFSFLTVVILGIAKEKGFSAPEAYNLEWKGLFNIISYSGLVVLIFVIALVFEHGRLKAQKQLEEKNTALDKALKELRVKNNQILSSIHYAQRIQTAILPSEKYFEHSSQEHFTLFRPRDIVSGDFYWFHAKGGKMFLAVIDCTGHGVPGALLSMIGHSLFNKIILEWSIQEPASILDHLQTEMRRILRGKKAGLDTNDGMDVCLCMIDPKEQITIFSGAIRPLYYVSMAGNTPKLMEYKGDRKVIGGERQAIHGFTNHTIKTSPGDMIYLTSDGFSSQFNPFLQKYGSTRLKKILPKIAHMEINDQKDVLCRELDRHQGDEEQIDDITIIGARISKYVNK